MSIKETGKPSTSESKSDREMLEQIAELKAENQLLSSIKEMMGSPTPSGSVEREHKLRQVSQNIHDMLTNEGFKEAYRIIVDDLQATLFNTQPGETEERERLYYQAQAMNALLVKLGYMVRSVQIVKPKAELG